MLTAEPQSYTQQVSKYLLLNEQSSFRKMSLTVCRENGFGEVRGGSTGLWEVMVLDHSGPRSCRCEAYCQVRTAWISGLAG